MFNFLDKFLTVGSYFFNPITFSERRVKSIAAKIEKLEKEINESLKENNPDRYATVINKLLHYRQEKSAYEKQIRELKG